MESVLVVAFDGLDYELIEKHDCNTIMQDTFGRIDNHTGMSAIMTSELFASFITGKTHLDHGVRGLKRWENDKIEKTESLLNAFWIFRKFAGIRKAIYTSITSLEGAYERAYTRKDLKCQTMFETVPRSKALNVPAYNRNPWIDIFTVVLEKQGIEQVERLLEAEQQYREQELVKELGKNYDLLMAHFHYPDAIQDIFAHKKISEDESKIKQAYKRMEELASTIKEQAADKFDVIIFMSDHGKPAENGHNQNAFYSVNRDLNLKEPHITEFRGIIERHTGIKSGRSSAAEKGDPQDRESEILDRLQQMGYR